MLMASLFSTDDLRRWRSCERRFWLARHRLRRGEPVTAHEPPPGLDVALRASFPHADTVAPPQTPSQWLQAMHHTLDCLNSSAELPEGWAILGACLTSEDRVQVRIDVLSAGEGGLRLFKLRHATVGDESDVDTVALWTHVAARCGFAVPPGAPRLAPAVAALARTWPHPRRCLRFDTIGMAVPVWSGTRPYQTLPFQWSCAVQAADGAWSDHQFLADAQGGDPRRAFAESLLRVLGDEGAALAYNAGFERNRIRELAHWFEDLAPALEALLPRIVDLYQVVRSHQQDPVMGGSWSFRAIARAVAPDIDLDIRLDPVLGVAHENSAQAVFALMQKPGQGIEVRQACRDALLARGQRETVVLRRLLALFDQAAS